MDKTEMYVRMADCVEVQGQWDMGREANYFAWRTVDGKFPVYVDRRPGGAEKSSVWLPRQDQIQEMIEGNIHDIFLGKMGNGEFDGLDGFVDFFYENYSMYGLDSMEKIWLAYYMQKHNKTWDGEKWVKNK